MSALTERSVNDDRGSKSVMHGNLPAAAGAAIIPTARSVSTEPITSEENSAQTGSEFFASVCKAIFGKDAGLALSMATGVPERSCYRYASGQREVPVLVLRAVLHSTDGEPFFRALMDGCTAPWWLEFERHARMGAAADKESRA